MAVRLGPAVSLRIERSAYDRLTRSRQGPIGLDIQARGLRVTRQMKANAAGRPGPERQTSNLYNAIAFLRFDVDATSLYAHIGAQNHRMIRRGFNYALILEGFFPRGGAPPDGAYPFMERSLQAAKD